MHPHPIDSITLAGMKVRYTVRAQSDLDAIYTDLDQRNPKAIHRKADRNLDPILALVCSCTARRKIPR
jgi:hypothetical protein